MGVRPGRQSGCFGIEHRALKTNGAAEPHDWASQNKPHWPTAGLRPRAPTPGCGQGFTEVLVTEYWDQVESGSGRDQLRHAGDGAELLFVGGAEDHQQEDEGEDLRSPAQRASRSHAGEWGTEAIGGPKDCWRSVQTGRPLATSLNHATGDQRREQLGDDCRQQPGAWILAGRPEAEAQTGGIDVQAGNMAPMA